MLLLPYPIPTDRFPATNSSLPQTNGSARSSSRLLCNAYDPAQAACSASASSRARPAASSLSLLRGLLARLFDVIRAYSSTPADWRRARHSFKDPSHDASHFLRDDTLITTFVDRVNAGGQGRLEQELGIRNRPIEYLIQHYK